MLSEAQSMEVRGDFRGAHGKYIEALELNPKSAEAKSRLNALGHNPRLPKADNRRADTEIGKAVARQSQAADDALSRNDFSAAIAAVERLEAFPTGIDLAREKRQQISDQAALRAQQLELLGDESMRGRRFGEAYLNYSLAAGMPTKRPDLWRKAVRAQKLHRKQRGYSFEDRLYADKLYYLAAISVSGGEGDNARMYFNKLEAFDPTYERLRELEMGLVEKGMIGGPVPGRQGQRAER